MLLFFSEQECRKVGFSEPMIRTLKRIAEFVDAIDRLATVEEQNAAQQEAVDALQEANEDQNLTLTSLDTRIDHFELLEPFVRQDQGPAWTAPAATASRAALPAYSAAAISNPPTQAEVQAIATQLAAVTGAAAGVITDGQSNGSLT